MPDVLSRLPVGCSWSWRYNRNQPAIFAPLTTVNRPHHQARGFDQAKETDRELDRARHSKRIDRSACATELTFDCNNSVINLIVVILSRIAASHDKNICAAGACGVMRARRWSVPTAWLGPDKPSPATNTLPTKSA
jgi:hypothetical protein